MENQTSRPVVNVICIKWGSSYTSEDVNKLYRAVVRNAQKHQINFHCFTEVREGLDENIQVNPLPVVSLHKYAYIKEAGLCDDALAGLTGERVFFFDLDSVIVGELDTFFDLPQGTEFFAAYDPNTQSDRIAGANFYSWVVGTLGYAKAFYDANAESVVAKYYTASQEYLSDQVLEKFDKINFWPKSYIASFKMDLKQPWPLNYFLKPRRPSGEMRLINFHGDPKMKDAVDGKWSTRLSIKWYKRWYKFSLPADWILEYWK